MFPSVNTDITTMGLRKTCEIATIIYKYCILFHLNTAFAHFKKTLYKKLYKWKSQISSTQFFNWSDQMCKCKWKGF